MIGTDLLVLIGTDLANNQPVTTKYMHFAKEQGTRIVVVNPFREPALDRYWVPSVAKSALWGTALMDDFFAVRPGGDIAFMLGALKALDARNLFDEKFIAERTVGFDELREEARALSWDELERRGRAAARGDRALRRAVRRRRSRGAALFDGPDAVRVRRRQREDGGQPGAVARQHRAREDRHHPHPRPLRRAGHRRVRRRLPTSCRAASTSPTRIARNSRRRGAIPFRTRRGSRRRTRSMPPPAARST